MHAAKQFLGQVSFSGRLGQGGPVRLYLSALTVRGQGMRTTLQLDQGQDAGPAVSARTILVVEDETLVRETIACELEDAGFAVIEAETAEQGLEILERRPVGVLFTDIRLPGRMDGWELAERARALYPHLPVIYATGFSGEEPRFVERSVFLRKPYLPSAVIAAVDKLASETPDRPLNK
jgi:CheY-like chemotaxis protein